MVRGPLAMLGYYGNEQATQAAIEPGGWPRSWERPAWSRGPGGGGAVAAGDDGRHPAAAPPWCAPFGQNLVNRRLAALGREPA
jgi:hypothetical protein